MIRQYSHGGYCGTTLEDHGRTDQSSVDNFTWKDQLRESEQLESCFCSQSIITMAELPHDHTSVSEKGRIESARNVASAECGGRRGMTFIYPKTNII